MTYDTLATARALADAGLDPRQADAIATAIREAAESKDYVTRADLDAAITGLEARLYRFLLIQAAGIVGLTVAIIRLLD